jgi:hypothetical protein
VLAEETAAAVSAGEEERSELVSAALVVGQWLAEHGRPGRWDTIDARAVLEALALPDDVERDRFLFALLGLLGHARLQGFLSRTRARAYFCEIEALATHAVVRGLSRTMVRQLAS